MSAISLFRDQKSKMKKDKEIKPARERKKKTVGGKIS